MSPTTPRVRAVTSLAFAAIWMGFGILRFDQGLDLGADGRWVLGAWLEAQGTAVHALVDTGDGPFRYVVLGTWMRVFGGGFGAAAVLETILHSVLAALLSVWTLRRGFPATLFGQLALLAAAPLPFGALWAGITVLIPATLPKKARPETVCGLFLAGLLVTDALWFLISAAILLAASRRNGGLAELGPVARGLAAGAAIVLFHGLVSGAVSATLTNAFAGPWWSLFDGPGPGQIFRALGSGPWLDTPFAGVTTGERLPEAWPAHASLRAAGLRVAGALVLLGPLAWLLRRRLGLAATLSYTAVFLVLARGDLPTLQIGLVLIILAWITDDDLRPGLHRAALLFAGFAALTPLAENVWLAARSGRDSLVRWDHPRADVRIDRLRRDGLEEAIDRLHLPPEQPAMIWPDLGGLHVLLQTRPAVPQLVPPRSEDADRSIAHVLGSDRPPVVLFAPSPSLLPQNLERALPLTATALRRQYSLRGSLPAGGLNLRAIAPGSRPGDPLAARIPRVECVVAPEAQSLSPALRDDLAVGQSFRIEQDDLRGFAIRLVTQADSVEVELRARVWERPGAEYNSLLDARTLTLVARRDQPMHWIEFPVSDTAGRDLALLFETRGTPRAEVRFAWHENASGHGIGDVYRQGTAMLDFTPVDADLIMLIY